MKLMMMKEDFIDMVMDFNPNVETQEVQIVYAQIVQRMVQVLDQNDSYIQNMQDVFEILEDMNMKNSENSQLSKQLKEALSMIEHVAKAK